MTANHISGTLSEGLILEKYKPCGVFFSDEKPEKALEIKKKGNGCIVPLIMKASTGVPLVVAEESTGWPCSAFYLGFQDTIFEGIEYFPVKQGRFLATMRAFYSNSGNGQSICRSHESGETC